MRHRRLKGQSWQALLTHLTRYADLSSTPPPSRSPSLACIVWIFLFIYTLQRLFKDILTCISHQTRNAKLVSIGLMLIQRCRRWTNNKSTLVQCLLGIFIDPHIPSDHQYYYMYNTMH